MGTSRGRLTCRSPGKKTEQIAYPQSIVRMQIPVFKFHNFNCPARDSGGFRSERNHIAPPRNRNVPLLALATT